MVLEADKGLKNRDFCSLFEVNLIILTLKKLIKRMAERLHCLSAITNLLNFSSKTKWRQNIFYKVQLCFKLFVLKDV